MRTSSRAGSPTTVLREPRAQPLGHRIEVLARHDGAADGRALLAGLDGHLARHFLHEEIELLVVGRHVGREDRAVERVGLGVERDRLAHDVRVHAQLGGGVGRAGEGHDVGAVEPVEQVAGAADHELQAARGQEARAVRSGASALR